MPYWFRRGHVDISTERFHVSSRLSTLFICHIAYANSHVLIIVRTQDFLLDSLWCFQGLPAFDLYISFQLFTNAYMDGENWECFIQKAS